MGDRALRRLPAALPFDALAAMRRRGVARHEGIVRRTGLDAALREIDVRIVVAAPPVRAIAVSHAIARRVSAPRADRAPTTAVPAGIDP